MSKPFNWILVLDIESTWGRAIELGFSCQTMEEYIRDPRFKLWGLSWAILYPDGTHNEVWVRANGLKKFFDLMPNLQASDFDYVIFDMPPLGQTSPTLGMAGFMDKMLLVVESEANNRDAVKRGYEALVASRDNVSVVFNKARSYIPRWLHSDS